MMHIQGIMYTVHMVTGMITVSILNKAFKHDYVAAQGSLCVFLINLLGANFQLHKPPTLGHVTGMYNSQAK